jgi:3-oxosteroid 1-dehydrogenase
LNQTYDVIVLGSGISGLAAALSAAENGLRTLLIEKADKLGGGTVYSFGLLWVGNNHLAREAGYDDSREDVIRYMKFLAAGEALEPNLLAYVDRADDAIRFFERCGIGFTIARGVKDHYVGVAPGARDEGRTLEANLISGHELGAWRERVRVPGPEPYYLLGQEQIAWGGLNRIAHWDQDLIKRRQGADMRGKGWGLACNFLKALLARNVDIVTGEAIQALITQGERVVGVWNSANEPIEAKLGVVLATGGYEANPELVRAFEGLPNWGAIYPSSVSGDGMILATEIGAAVEMLRNHLVLQFGFHLGGVRVSDEPAFRPAGRTELCSPHTLVVNKHGRRFADEAYFQEMVGAMRRFEARSHEYVNLPAYLIFDQQYVWQFCFAEKPAGSVPDWVQQDDTLDGLARKLGIDASGLVQTVERFNGFARNGRDEDFARGEYEWRLNTYNPVGLKNHSLGEVREGPFYGVELYICGNGGAGVLTNEHAQVMNARRRPIPGLYAIGNASVHRDYGSGYQAGYSLTSGMTFGFLATEHMLHQEALAR